MVDIEIEGLDETCSSNKRYNVVHVNPQGKKTVIRKNVSLKVANEAFYGIDNTYIEEVEGV